MPFPLRFRRVPAGGRAVLAAAWPPSTVSFLLAASLAVGLLQLAARRWAGGAADPVFAWGALSAPGLRAGEFWQPLTHLFLTGALWTLPFSLALIYLAGRPLEARLGWRHALSLYALAGAAGGLGQVGLDQLRAGPAAGEALAGATAPAFAFCLAAACLAPDALLPLGRRFKARHLALGALALLAVALLAGDAAVRRAAGPQLARCLLGGLTGCLYARAVATGPRVLRRARRPLAAPAAPPPASSAPSVPRWSEPPSAPPAVLTAPPPAATAAAQTLAAPRFTERERRMSAREYVAEQIDPILDKILLHGVASLTPEERRLLEKGREKIAGQRD